jgi:NAD(P)-dependent dehydrogenase (short-subunit alcohol dehydrogenase family)
MVADLSSGPSISALAESFGVDRPLHALVNNAAITPTARQESAEGVELQWAVNVLGYHRLVKSFLPQLQLAAGEARVVFVASFYAGGLRLADPEFKAAPYSADAAYRASKQANRMLAAAWASSDQGTGLLFTSCHPGVATSNVSLGLGFDLDRSEKAAVAGAQTPLFLANCARGDSGKRRVLRGLALVTTSVATRQGALSSSSYVKVCARRVSKLYGICTPNFRCARCFAGPPVAGWLSASAFVS